MSYRRKQVWISSDVLAALEMIGEIRPPRIDEQGFSRILTEDEMADELLREMVKEKYPEILEFRTLVRKRRKAFLEELKAAKPQ